MESPDDKKGLAVGNMSHEDEIDYWREVEGGFRASVMLRLGSFVLAAGALANLATRLLAGPGDASVPLTILSWVLFISGLWLVGGGFIWVGAGPFLTRFGFVVGALHILGGAQFLLLLFTSVPAVIAPASLTIARMATVILFVWIERESLSERTGAFLGTIAGLQLTKVVLREMGAMPDLGAPGGPLLDVVILLGLAAAFLQLGISLRQEENDWAIQMYATGNSDFADFNNPEHHWNKVSPAAEQQETDRIKS